MYRDFVLRVMLTIWAITLLATVSPGTYAGGIQSRDDQVADSECAKSVTLAFTESKHWVDAHYDNNTGSSFDGSFWTDSNTMETLHLLMLQTHRSDFDGIADTSFLGRNALIPTTDWNTFTGDFIDDAGWAVLALWRMADYKLAHGEPRVEPYLKAAATVYDRIASNWDDTCGGGVWWTIDHTYKNAVTNELFLTLSAQGYLRFKNETYLENAKKSWAWIEGSGMRNAQGLYNDGLVLGSCVNNGETTWTYNQGVILSGLGALYAATGNETLLSEAEITADATIKNLTENGILKESCDDVAFEGTSCDGDQGIWLKHLQYYLTFVSPKHPERIAKYSAFIGAQSKAVLNFATDAELEIGSVWYGPDVGGSIFSAQSLGSGIMAHVASAEYGPCD